MMTMEGLSPGFSRTRVLAWGGLPTGTIWHRSLRDAALASLNRFVEFFHINPHDLGEM